MDLLTVGLLRVLGNVASQFVDRGETQRALWQFRLNGAVDIQGVTHAIDDPGLENGGRARFLGLAASWRRDLGFARRRNWLCFRGLGDRWRLRQFRFSWPHGVEVGVRERPDRKVV